MTHLFPATISRSRRRGTKRPFPYNDRNVSRCIQRSSLTAGLPFASLSTCKERYDSPLRKNSRSLGSSQQYTEHARQCDVTGANNFSLVQHSQGSVQRSSPSAAISQPGSSTLRSASSSQHLNGDSGTSHCPRRVPRIQISSLLIDSRANRSYRLEVVQQPQRGAEFLNFPLSRLPITPVIIIRLQVQDPSGNPVIPEDELPFLVAHLSLISENGRTHADTGPSPLRPSPPSLYGNLVASVDYLEDLQGNMGFFFIFSDVSVRWRGRYQLGVTLMRVASLSPDPNGILRIEQNGAILAETRTQSFDVVAQGQYSAVATTRLTQSFIRQGARIFSHSPHLAIS